MAELYSTVRMNVFISRVTGLEGSGLLGPGREGRIQGGGRRGSSHGAVTPQTPEDAGLRGSLPTALAHPAVCADRTPSSPLTEGMLGRGASLASLPELLLALLLRHYHN